MTVGNDRAVDVAMDVATTRASVVAAGKSFTESPRWHEGRLWYLDVSAHALRTIDLGGRDELVEEFPERPSAVDFLPDGTPLVAFGAAKKIIRLADHSVYADLGGLENRGVRFTMLNDMLVDGLGRLFVDCYAAVPSFTARTVDVGDAIAVIDTSGEATIAASGVFAPNGITAMPGGDCLVVAESLRSRLVEYAVTSDGTLTDRRIFALTRDDVPDGICADAEGAIWSSGIHTGRANRVHRGGMVSHSVVTEAGHFAIAVTLGGPEGRHLFIATCEHVPFTSWAAWRFEPTSAFIEVAEVEVAGARRVAGP